MGFSLQVQVSLFLLPCLFPGNKSSKLLSAWPSFFSIYPQKYQRPSAENENSEKERAYHPPTRTGVHLWDQVLGRQGKSKEWAYGTNGSKSREIHSSSTSWSICMWNTSTTPCLIITSVSQVLQFDSETDQVGSCLYKSEFEVSWPDLMFGEKKAALPRMDDRCETPWCTMRISGLRMNKSVRSARGSFFPLAT